MADEEANKPTPAAMITPKTAAAAPVRVLRFADAQIITMSAAEAAEVARKDEGRVATAQDLAVAGLAE